MPGTNPYRIEVKTLSRDAWTSILNKFADASLYQTWEYGQERCGAAHLSHIVLYKDDAPVAAAQVMRLPPRLLKWGAALVHWGPMWHPQSTPPDQENLSQLLKAMYKEYIQKRGWLLRLTTRDYDDAEHTIENLMKQHGFTIAATADHRRTIHWDLHPTEDELYKQQRQSWRKNLRRAWNSSVTTRVDQGESMCEIMPPLFEEMHRRQKFVKGGDVTPFINVEKNLPQELKFRFYSAWFEDEPMAALAMSCIGDTPVGVVAATAERGRKNRAMYAVYWTMVEDLKAQGFEQVDLGGIDEIGAPGITRFKQGLVGHTDEFEVDYAGPFQACESWISSFAIAAGEHLRNVYYFVRHQLNKWILRNK